jgi:hypothetical protein
MARKTLTAQHQERIAELETKLTQAQKELVALTEHHNQCLDTHFACIEGLERHIFQVNAENAALRKELELRDLTLKGLEQYTWGKNAGVIQLAR